MRSDGESEEEEEKEEEDGIEKCHNVFFGFFHGIFLWWRWGILLHQKKMGLLFGLLQLFVKEKGDRYGGRENGDFG